MTKHSDTASQPNLEVLTMEHGFVAHIFSFPVRKAELLYQDDLRNLSTSHPRPHHQAHHKERKSMHGYMGQPHGALNTGCPP